MAINDASRNLDGSGRISAARLGIRPGARVFFTCGPDGSVMVHLGEPEDPEDKDMPALDIKTAVVGSDGRLFLPPNLVPQRKGKIVLRLVGGSSRAIQIIASQPVPPPDKSRPNTRAVFKMDKERRPVFLWGD